MRLLLVFDVSINVDVAIVLVEVIALYGMLCYVLSFGAPISTNTCSQFSTPYM